MNTIYEAIAEAVRRREAVALVTIVQTSGSTPRQVGTKMLIHPDGTSMGTIGGGVLEAAIIEAAQEALAEGKLRLVHYGLRADKHGEDLGVCGGDLDAFIDVIAPQFTLLLIGAGHVAVPLAQLAHLLGFRTVIFDDRAEYANRDRFPQAEEVLVEDFETGLNALDITPSTWVVIATRSHESDAVALRAMVESPAAYVGLLGSRRKVGLIFKALREEGVGEKQLARVYAPVGLDLRAETPEEIALSIMAEIIMVRQGGKGQSLSARKGTPKVPGTSEKAVCLSAADNLKSAFAVKSSVKVPGT
jgi:xanthine dehydrogenase accessory factor